MEPDQTRAAPREVLETRLLEDARAYLRLTAARSEGAVLLLVSDLPPSMEGAAESGASALDVVLLLLSRQFLGRRCRDILAILGPGPLKAAAIAHKLGMEEASTGLRQRLSILVERGVLSCDSTDGYHIVNPLFLAIASQEPEGVALPLS
jgi:hypothetical protein